VATSAIAKADYKAAGGKGSTGHIILADGGAYKSVDGTLCPCMNPTLLPTIHY
jgi:hypothetical protein